MITLDNIKISGGKVEMRFTYITGDKVIDRCASKLSGPTPVRDFLIDQLTNDLPEYMRHLLANIAANQLSSYMIKTPKQILADTEVRLTGYALYGNDPTPDKATADMLATLDVSYLDRYYSKEVEIPDDKRDNIIRSLLHDRINIALEFCDSSIIAAACILSYELKKMSNQ